MPRTQSECTTSSMDDEEFNISPLWQCGVADKPEEDNVEQEIKEEKSFITLRERRQIKLGLRKVRDARFAPERINSVLEGCSGKSKPGTVVYIECVI